MRLVLVTIVAFAACIFPCAAFADAQYLYTLNIPVTATNLPAGSTLAAACNYTTASGAASLIGVSSPVTPANGAYSGTLTVAHSSPAPLVAYACVVTVNNGSNPYVNLSGGAPFTNYTPSGPAAGWTGTIS
jgi:hypothetical protein